MVLWWLMFQKGQRMNDDVMVLEWNCFFSLSLILWRNWNRKLNFFIWLFYLSAHIWVNNLSIYSLFIVYCWKQTWKRLPILFSTLACSWQIIIIFYHVSACMECGLIWWGGSCSLSYSLSLSLHKVVKEQIDMNCKLRDCELSCFCVWVNE